MHSASLNNFSIISDERESHISRNKQKVKERDCDVILRSLAVHSRFLDTMGLVHGSSLEPNDEQWTGSKTNDFKFLRSRRDEFFDAFFESRFLLHQCRIRIDYELIQRRKVGAR